MKLRSLLRGILVWGLMGSVLTFRPAEAQELSMKPDSSLDQLDELLQAVDELNICTADVLECDYVLSLYRGQCGNDVADFQEECDGLDLRSQTCSAVTNGARPYGMLRCNSDCTLDATWCTQQRFVENGNGTITDNQTDLMWEQKSVGRRSRLLRQGRVPRFRQQGDACLALGHAPDAVCTWFQALAWIDALNAQRFAGYTDWRLPTVQELVTIVDYERLNPSVRPIFTSTQAAPYWSSTSVAFSSSDAWGVDYSNGHVFFDNKNLTAHVRAVRGGS